MLQANRRNFENNGLFPISAPNDIACIRKLVTGTSQSQNQMSMLIGAPSLLKLMVGGPWYECYIVLVKIVLFIYV